MKTQNISFQYGAFIAKRLCSSLGSTARVALLILAVSLETSLSAHAQTQGLIRQDVAQKVVTVTDGAGDLALRLNYDHQCVLDQVVVRGRQVIAPSGVVSGIREDGQWRTTRSGIDTPQVVVSKDTLSVSGIVFGKPGAEVHESWLFKAQANGVVWRISRNYQAATTLEDAAFPEWDFSSLSTWKGGILGNGGVVWNKYLDTDNATYGAHTGAVTFWNPEQNDCLRITPKLPDGYNGAVRFSHQGSSLSFNYVVSRDELKPKHDLRRYLSDRQDLWAPFNVEPGEVNVEFTLQAPSYDKAYDRGVFQGVDGGSIRELLNTVARYGVIDNHLIGANGWRSGYMCLHEQWFSQIGLALADPNYNANMAANLDFERDHAISPDGRVLARWCYGSWDAMPGTYTDLGYYEAQWGYLIDSQPDYVMNVAELYNLTGDAKWLAGQKGACEKALNYLIRREVGDTGLVTVLTDSRTQAKGSDWFDIVWASYQNALIDAELYNALNLWANAEDTLGDANQAKTYRAFAARLKTSFNRPISEGGFWDPANQWYVYWRDKDGSVHGNNLSTAVNFAAIGYGICDDPARQKAILDRIESETQKEKLFTWPVNFFTYDRDEASGGNFPFPRYENGDIFMSWGELGVRAYAAYDPVIALKYIKQTLARYQADGLSFQRYLRNTQEGAGDDILAGNCMSIVGLYRDIYGVQPRSNRLYLAPHLTDELNGTQLRYPLRGQQYGIDLSTKGSWVSANGCALSAATPFGANASGAGLQYFPGESDEWALSVTAPKNQELKIQIDAWADDSKLPYQWTETGQRGRGNIVHTAALLSPGAEYKLTINGKTVKSLRADNQGRVTFTVKRSDTAPQTFELLKIVP